MRGSGITVRDLSACGLTCAASAAADRHAQAGGPCHRVDKLEETVLGWQWAVGNWRGEEAECRVSGVECRHARPLPESRFKCASNTRRLHVWRKKLVGIKPKCSALSSARRSAVWSSFARPPTEQFNMQPRCIPEAVRQANLNDLIAPRLDILRAEGGQWHQQDALGDQTIGE